MLLSLEGDESTGKTTLAYSAPLKIVGFAFDIGWERALKGGKYKELFEGLTIEAVPYMQEPTGNDFDILIYELPPPINVDTVMMAGAKELWAYFLPKVVAALSDPKVRSVVIDTATLARRVRVNMHLQILQEEAIKEGKAPRRQLLQIEYGTPNDAMRDIIAYGSSVRKNLILTHHLTDERKDVMDGKGELKQVMTGNRILEGLTGTHRLVDVALRMNKTSKHNIEGTYVKCGYDLQLEGQKVEDPTWDKIVTRLEMMLGERITFDRRNGK